jgi:hypothetical protein
MISMKLRNPVPVICLVLMLVMTACGNVETESSKPAAEQRNTEIIEGNENVVIQAEYHTEEIHCTNEGEDIYIHK